MTNYVKTTNFLRKDSLPDDSIEKIIRGSEFDTEFNNLVISIATKANLISPVFAGVPTAPTAPYGSKSKQIATTAFVSENAIIKGMILMWSGSVAAIPGGWSLCNGVGGTPNLTNRFVIGAGATYSPDATGGSAVNALPAHTHSATTVIQERTGLNGTLTLKNRGGTSGAQSLMAARTGAVNIDSRSSGSFGEGWKGEGGNNSSTASWKLNHAHGATTTLASAGTSGSDANLPPYYALAYIIKN